VNLHVRCLERSPCPAAPLCSVFSRTTNFSSIELSRPQEGIPVCTENMFGAAPCLRALFQPRA